MKIVALTMAALAVSSPALAETIHVKPLIDARLRYENVDQVGIANEADAVTLRLRTGFEAKYAKFSFLVESETTLAISEKYNSGLNGKTAYPVVADPQNIELNRIQLQYSGLPKTLITVGRQRINLDDQRFVGSAGWRDNEQTFDAARVEWSGIKNLKADITYAWSDRTIWGIDGFDARPRAIGGDNVFANLAWKQKFGQLSGFAYLVDQDEAAVSGFKLSSQTYGARYAGSYPLSKKAKLTVAASYARQSDFHRNPNNYHADYYLGEVGLEAYGWKVLGGYEVLGHGGGVRLTSFQTPLATLHKFQGWADQFLTTPANGVRDAYGSLGYTKPKVGPFDSIGATAVYHDFRSDRLGQHYGHELDLQLAAKRKRWNYLLKYADYRADSFKTNTRKLWAQIEWIY
ncbi:alginate export family protein [Sphingomonas sp.]|uniref:alginate export family protein n=1 Tax=Sphingomonas sp. TaxID=28214 RepID=UPI003750E701